MILATGIAERLERELGYNVLGDPVPWRLSHPLSEALNIVEVTINRCIVGELLMHLRYNLAIFKMVIHQGLN